jgi:hypothetical protein
LLSKELILALRELTKEFVDSVVEFAVSVDATVLELEVA